MKIMSEAYKQKQMGVVSNLITDMTIKGASSSELARAVRHSMVVIDAAKHKLNYRQSEKDNAIQQLKDKYQSNEPNTGHSKGGTTTLISASGKTSAERIDKRIPRPAAQGGPIDPKTGKKVFVRDPRAAYTTKDGETKYRKESVSKLALADDANVYVSKPGTPMERIYADHSNRLKSMANQARKEAYHTKESKKSPSAEKAYANEVATLNAKLNVALKNAPLERQAQVLAQSRVKAARQTNPEMGADKEKKIARAEIEKARAQTGAGKDKIVFTAKEWEAVQAGAISPSRLNDILKHADMDNVKQHALPKPKLLMTSSKTARAKTMQAAGYTLAEIAAQLGVSQTTLKDALYD
jgi:AraC-like DNA-binding protein